MSLDQIRLTLLISLGILFLVLLFRRFKRKTMERDLPAVQHMELLTLEVMYHPTRLRAEVSVPRPQEFEFAMLDLEHAPLFEWPPQRVKEKHAVLELPVEGHADGDYYFQLSTNGQRTIRRFTLRRS
jgi:hypothetical protein